MGSSNILIKLVLEGFTKAKAQMNNLGKTTDDSSGKLNKFGTVAKVGAIAVGTVLAKALSSATREFIEFEDKLNQSLAIMKTTEEQQIAMGRSARQVAIETRISADESAEAFFFLASAGLDAEQSIQALPQVSKFAQAGMFDMALATDLATDSQSALGLTVKDAQQNLENLTRVTDVLVKANTLANASVQQFAEALTTKSGSALKITNKSIEEGVAVLSAFADRGVKGAEAGEKLNQLLRDVTRAVGKNSEEFKKFNINVVDNEGNLKNLADVVDELDSGMSGLSDQQKAVLLDTLGLNRGVADAVKILSGAGDQIREYQSALENAGGVTQEVADKQVDSLQGQLEILNSKFSELGFIILDELQPALDTAIKGMSGLLSDIILLTKDTEELTKAEKERADELGIMKFVMAGVSYETARTLVENDRLKQQQLEQARNMTISHQRFKDLIVAHKDLQTNIHELDRETGVLNRTREESIEVTEEEIEAEKKLARDRATAGLDAIRSLNDAYQNLRDIEEDRLNLVDKEAKALTKLNKANKDLEQANNKVEQAKEDFNKVSGLGAKVTNEEALAIARQREQISELEKVEEKSEIQKLQLAVARERLNELIEQSTAISREEEQALRDIERAEEDVIKQTEKLQDAQNDYRQATEDLAKATANSTENILEMALAKAELDSALEDLKSAEKFKDGINEIVRLIGGDLDTLTNQFNALFNLAGREIGNQGLPPTENKVIDDIVEAVAEEDFAPTTPAPTKKFGSLGQAGEQFVDRFAESTGGRVGTGAGGTIITVNTGNLLGTSEDVQLAVAEALKQAQRKGINVAL
jgi:TP901 family phage tail tape measure protein